MWTSRPKNGRCLCQRKNQNNKNNPIVIIAYYSEWLVSNNKNIPIYTDEVTGLRLTSFGHITGYNYDILPSTIDRRAYVYLINTNTKKGKVYERYDIVS